MARQRASVGRSSGRPTAPPARPAPQQKRPASTSAAPAQHTPPTAPGAAPAAGSQGPGLFANMASTAAGVAVGSSIGHAIGGFFGGGSSEAAPAAQGNNVEQSNTNAAAQQNSWGQRSCDVDAKQFTQCMDDNNGNMQICSWYLEQLKACQNAAKEY